MKVSLVVAAGAHTGRVIPITGPQFLIGRDPQCQLRPASQAISKLHCAILIRDGVVYLRDYGSTNGTVVNDRIVQDTEIAVENGATLRVGPLDFRLQIELAPHRPDGTPLPSTSDEPSAALAAVKAATAGVPAVPQRDNTPNPAVRKAGAAPAPKPAAKPAPAQPTAAQPAKPEPTKPGTNETPSLTSSESVTDDDHDRIAAMLLGMDEEGNGNVPEGSTVMDMPNLLNSGTDEATKVDDKKKEEKPKPAQTREEMSSAANDLLRKYMRRPK
jgi:predicted component of type VI protein secretion system